MKEYTTPSFLIQQFLVRTSKNSPARNMASVTKEESKELKYGCRALFNKFKSQRECISVLEENVKNLQIQLVKCEQSHHSNMQSSIVQGKE